jgi:hypothetical protein
VRINVMGNHGGLPCESIYGSFADADELKKFLNSKEFGLRKLDLLELV